MPSSPEVVKRLDIFAAMATVAVSPPALPAEAAAKMAKIEAALAACAEKHKCKVRCTALNKNLETVWFTEMPGVPGFMGKVAVSKARSFFDGKNLASPDPCSTMCCYLCPWCCGCTNQMAVQGTVAFELASTDVACLVVNGAPAGKTDLDIANEMVGIANGGAPDAANMSR